jgi:hypothetical protein
MAPAIIKNQIQSIVHFDVGDYKEILLDQQVKTVDALADSIADLPNQVKITVKTNIHVVQINATE